MNPKSSATIRFGDFEFDQRTLELRRGDDYVHLAPKPSGALGLLLANAGATTPATAVVPMR